MARDRHLDVRSKVAEPGPRASSSASRRAREGIDAGIRSMACYAQAPSVFELLLEREGTSFVRSMVRQLSDGAERRPILRERHEDPEPVGALERHWLPWLRAGAPSGPRSDAKGS